MKKESLWKHIVNLLAVSAMPFCFMSAALMLCWLAVSMRNRSRNLPSVPEYVFTYAENQAADYPTSEGAFRFAELVSERTEGRIEIQVKTGAEFGDEQSVLEQMQFGGIDFARVSLSPLSELLPPLNVLQMPYIYSSREHMWAVLDGEIGDWFMGFFRNIPLEPLSWYDGGARSFYTTVPIRSLADMQGLRIRVQQSALMEDMVEAFGAEAVPMAFDEVYSAIQKGEIDGAENSWPSYESERHYEVARYYTVDEHARVPEMQLASQITWDKLSAEDQAIIRECASESALYQRKAWEEREKRSELKVREAGCTVLELSAAEQKKFREAAASVYDKYCADYMDVVEAIRNMAPDSAAF